MIATKETYVVIFRFDPSGCVKRWNGESKEAWEERCEAHMCDTIMDKVAIVDANADIECIGRDCVGSEGEPFCDLRVNTESRLAAQAINSAIDATIRRMGGRVL